MILKGSGGTQHSATTRDTQAPKRKDMRSTTVGGVGGGVRHGVLVCRAGEEGGGRCAGGGCSSRYLIVTLCCQGKKFRKDTKEAVKKSSAWFPLLWGWGSFQSMSGTERAQESFGRKMRKLSLYNDKEKPLVGSIDGSLATIQVFTQNNTILMLSSDKGLQNSLGFKKTGR